MQHLAESGSASSANVTPAKTAKRGLKQAARTTCPQGQDAVNWRVRILWPDGKWYSGAVMRFYARGYHYVCYDDLDRELLKLSTQRMEFDAKHDGPVSFCSTSPLFCPMNSFCRSIG